ncbi:MAG: VIT1/CCC1 transporter family protein [Cytophagaceae bacterium]|nr:VIT1/CCC1 transporter family protein [Cytophagaceae bacterium]
MEQHQKGSDFIRDVVIGMADGLTVPFALAAGLSGAVDSTAIVITAGLAEIAAGSIAMGLGGYLAGQTEQEHYAAELAREHEEVIRVPDIEKAEVRAVLADYGLSEPLQVAVADEMALNPKKWVDFMMRFELGLEKPDIHRAKKSAFNIGTSYIVGGIIPLSPYFFTETSREGLVYSCYITVLTLLVFGYFKSRATGQPPVAGALKVAAIGTVAAGAAYFIAKLVGGAI